MRISQLREQVNTVCTLTSEGSAGGRTRLKVGMELRQTATGSLLWVRRKTLVHTVASVAYLIFESGPLRKNPDVPLGDIGIFGVSVHNGLVKGIISDLFVQEDNPYWFDKNQQV